MNREHIHLYQFQASSVLIAINTPAKSKSKPTRLFQREALSKHKIIPFGQRIKSSQDSRRLPFVSQRETKFPGLRFA